MGTRENGADGEHLPVQNVQSGIDLSRTLLEIESKGHTAMVHTKSPEIANRFAIGTFGGTSTTDNVTVSHLLNVKRLAEFIPSEQISEFFAQG